MAVAILHAHHPIDERRFLQWTRLCNDSDGKGITYTHIDIESHKAIHAFLPCDLTTKIAKNKMQDWHEHSLVYFPYEALLEKSVRLNELLNNCKYICFSMNQKNSFQFIGRKR